MNQSFGKEETMFSKIMLCCLAVVAMTASVQAITIKNVTYTTKTAGTVIFEHGYHLKQTSINNNCKACHSAIFDMKKRTHATMADMENGKSCGACHNGSIAFHVKDCVRCHKAKDIVLAVTGAGNVQFSHKTHTSRNSCNDCHTALFGFNKNKKPSSMADMEKGKSCGACHDGKMAFPVNANCADCHKM
jgi:c(7)-type cytochrome triheme protein